MAERLHRRKPCAGGVSEPPSSSMIFVSDHEPTSHPRSDLFIGKTSYVQDADRRCSNPESIGALGVSYLQRVETRGPSRREGRGHARDWAISFEIRLLSCVLPQPAEMDGHDNQREIRGMGYYVVEAD